ncbi:type II toxin-antitoxin system Phd/YefM family antitoxin [Enterococcus sp. LJL99]
MADTQNIEQPSYSITQLKQSPMAAFDLAEKEGTGLYVYNRGKAVGVMLTVEQYEQLSNKKTLENTTYEKLEKLNNAIRNKISFGSLISTKNLDEQLVSLGFISKSEPTEADDYEDVIQEINETGKIEYQLEKKEDRTNIFAEVIGEQSNTSQLPDKLIVKKIHLRSE